MEKEITLMGMPKKTCKNSIVFSLFCLSLFFFSGAVSAERAFTVSPIIFDREFVQPGDVFRERIQLRNEAPEPRNVKVVYFDVEPFGEEGNYRPIDDPDYEGDPRISMKSWIELETDSFVVKPEKEQRWTDFYFTLKVPQDALPGVHYGGIYFLPGGSDSKSLQNSGMILQARQGYGIILNVAGDVREKADIATFSIVDSFPKDQNQPILNKFFHEYGPVKFLTRIKNDGTTYIKPEGSITIRNMFGMVSDKIEFNIKKERALPDKIRRYKDEWTNQMLREDIDGSLLIDWSKISSFRFGYYTAELDLVYGKGAQPLKATVSFVMFPWKLILIMIIGLVILVTLFAMYRDWNEKRILRKFMNEQQPPTM